MMEIDAYALSSCVCQQLSLWLTKTGKQHLGVSIKRNLKNAQTYLVCRQAVHQPAFSSVDQLVGHSCLHSDHFCSFWSSRLPFCREWRTYWPIIGFHSMWAATSSSDAVCFTAATTMATGERIRTSPYVVLERSCRPDWRPASALDLDKRMNTIDKLVTRHLARARQ